MDPSQSTQDNTSASPMFMLNAPTVITGSNTFNQVTNNGWAPMDRLRVLQDSFDGYVAFNASHDTNDPIRPPRCHPKTCSVILQSSADWVRTTSDSSHILWIFGPAGVGKTAIAASLADILCKKGRLAASFFIRPDDNRNLEKVLVTTIAFQMAFYIPELQPHIASAVEANPLIFHQSPETQAEQFIITPILSLDCDFQRAIIIDGLDHCHSRDVQRRVLEIICDAAPRLSGKLVFLILSRPEHPIINAFTLPALKSITLRVDLMEDLGTSSASASVSSLSRPRGANSRAESRINVQSSTAPQTSANDLTSDEDEDMVGRHLLPPEPRDLSLASRFLLSDSESSLYLSEEEFDGYEEYGPDIEIDSVAYETSDRETYFDYSNPSRDSFTMDQGERRGSLAMHIPNTPSDRSYLDHCAREYSAANPRRSSRSSEDLHSFSAQGSGQYSSASRRADEHPLPPAPTSVPESEGKWPDLRKRSIQRDKDLPPIMPLANSSSTAVASSSSNLNGISSRGTSATDSFDTSSLQEYEVNGVVGFHPSELADIVEEGSLNGHRPSLYPFRKGSTASAARRQRTVSSNIDIIHKNITGPRSNPKSRDQQRMWTFTREKDRQDEGNRTHNGGQDKERKRPSISTLFASRLGTSAEHNNGVIPFFDKSEGKDKAIIGKSKEKPHKEPWRGMALDSEEIWFNGSSGKFRVNRRNALPVEAGKPPQQRLNITYIRGHYIFNATNRDTADGPAVTIHKHSKAAAFSISRHYRTRPSANSAGAVVPLHDTTASRQHSSSIGQVSSKDSADGSRKKSNMIMLGTRKVQRAYTSTNTTRKFESHGLLDDSGRTSPKDVERMRRDEHDKQRTRTKDQERKDKGKDKREAIEAPATKRSTAKGESKSREHKFKESKSKDIPLSAQALPDSSEGSSAGSVANALGDSGTLDNSSTAVTTPEHSEATNSAGSVGSVEQSILSQETTSSDRTISRANFYRSPPRRRGVYDIDDDDDEDSSKEHPRYSARTPHRETYAALPPEVFKSAHQEHPHPGFFGWGRSKGGDRNGYLGGPFEQSYNPLWPVTQPRSNTELRKGIVESLNTAFQDVHPKKHTKRTDIFEEVPEDALYMLLPLWPGETDPNSAKKYPYSPPPIPTNARQYILIYWKPHVPLPPVTQEEGSSKSKSAEKKRSQESPVASGDNVNDRVVLLHSFHISARVFAYHDLRGSGVRIPDLGLAVSGPLEDAYESIPSTICKDDYDIGICHSREAGIEFIPEGFEKMGLSRTMSNPRQAEPSEDQSFDAIQVLTPIGRAVMEMAWLGSMAVTSFNPNL